MSGDKRLFPHFVIVLVDLLMFYVKKKKNPNSNHSILLTGEIEHIL